MQIFRRNAALEPPRQQSADEDSLPSFKSARKAHESEGPRTPEIPGPQPFAGKQVTGIPFKVTA